MKRTNASFKMGKEVKSMMVLLTDKKTRGDFKRLMIEAQVTQESTERITALSQTQSQ